jgi:hypothetical protein
MQIEFVERLRGEWGARSKDMRIALVAVFVVVIVNIIAAVSLSWEYGDKAGPAGILCGSHHYLVALVLTYFGFRMWSGDPLGWYATLMTMCSVMAVSAVEGTYGSLEAFVHAGAAAFGLAGALAARKHFWRHSV